MSFDAQKTRFRNLDDWFNSPQGINIAGFFSSELNQLGDFLHGETLLQLGSYGKNDWLKALHYSHKWQATLYSKSSNSLISSYNQLPLDRNSVDCVVAPLIMEAFKFSNSPIDEIDRILKPMGYVVFFGINPFSLWGIYLRLKRHSCLGEKTKTVFSIQRAMIHRGYVQSYLSSFYYIPPVFTANWVEKLEILNVLGKMVSPCPAGFYCLVMQKQETAHPDLLLQNTEESWERGRVLQPSCFNKEEF
ncbi:MAG: methyltransferase domain-containing protein [Tatlockia sp.]|nr:methyltransferase domain-containing protein [Tatlockia sp.]